MLDASGQYDTTLHSSSHFGAKHSLIRFTTCRVAFSEILPKLTRKWWNKTNWYLTSWGAKSVMNLLLLDLSHYWCFITMEKRNKLLKPIFLHIPISKKLGWTSPSPMFKEKLKLSAIDANPTSFSYRQFLAAVLTKDSDRSPNGEGSQPQNGEIIAFPINTDTNIWKVLKISGMSPFESLFPLSFLTKSVLSDHVQSGCWDRNRTTPRDQKNLQKLLVY